ncbi:cytoplasmic asparaginyl-tRNA synthetase-like protein [Dothidotthia symphoricarpi CBS 119687]|uniref:asparagine--tRNA ligase n=1 Tax=Dothidotthia symphoricarpi CBS 119687 TaxID=1392245 RepID=A0A6A6AVW2_9PLEO|nr:cytoplasmic asparaginyl-tRNA synthetase-like protein [Dothidotthia symphoricarpi CBS 119687]KAF2134661.1 cytoplasmic asparaginyl-tRNA synthetase-like protein [Dothidotthia symphoricarpi CBS 119687]
MADATYYIDEDVGHDTPEQTGDESLPYKSLGYAVYTRGETAKFKTRKSVTGDVPEGADATVRLEWKDVAKAAMKKAVNYAKTQKKKAEKEHEQLALRQKEDAARSKVLEEAKQIVLEEDTSLDKAIKIKLDDTDSKKITLGDGKETKGTRVRVFGRVHRERRQKEVMFITLKDGYGYMQVLLTGKLAKTYDALTLTRETSMEILGELRQVPEGAHAPNNRELHADFYKIHDGWKAAGGDDAITNRVSKDTEHATLLDLRHLTLRGETASKVMIVRDAVEFAFNQVYKEQRLRKVSPPALVQTQVEGGSTLFKFGYYNEEAYLTQSSQLYLETCLPSMGDVYCIEKSFRAEKSLTRRHLAEYTHVEAELDYINFDDLLNHLEEVMCRVLEVTMSDPAIKQYITDLNPEFKMPERPFMRMKYQDAIDWLVEHNIPNEDGETHKFGDDIAEAAERNMTDIINRPIFLTHFPTAIKAFYMLKDKDDPRVTESVDCLMPGVGEIVGGSMRMDNHDELMAAFAREQIDPAAYYWYTDQRKYGSSPHGGYGLGLERFLAWLCKQHTVRDCCLYPRYFGRCKP